MGMFIQYKLRHESTLGPVLAINQDRAPALSEVNPLIFSCDTVHVLNRNETRYPSKADKIRQQDA